MRYLLYGIISVGVLVMGLYHIASKADPMIAYEARPPLVYAFEEAGVLEESNTPEKSTSPHWWVNSGGELIIEDGLGKTLQGDLPPPHPWRRTYSASNPIDTDNGKHPQNIFRLLSRNSWSNIRVQAKFKIVADNWSQSVNRNTSNGLFIITRYQDGNNLYYAGIRTDGTAIIKKKWAGEYYVLATQRLFNGEYHIDGTSNLIPHNEWIHLRVETSNNRDGSVTIRLFTKRESDVVWSKVLESKDTGTTNGPALTKAGPVGIRTDFMDVEFDDLRVENL